MIYFTSGHTARGFVQMAESNVEDVRLFILLRGGGECAQMECLKEVERRLQSAGEEFDSVRSPWNALQPEGLIVGDKAIWCGSLAPSLPSAATARHAAIRPDMLSAPPAGKTAHIAYDCFREALIIHDEWESIYINRFNKNKADLLAAQWIKKLFPGKSTEQSRTVHRFLGAATPSGSVDYIPELTEGLTKRYLIKGRAGTGKSTFMKKIAAAAEQNGYSAEIYHCGFDPASIDMVIVRELGFALFDSTKPHEYFPRNNTVDEIIDMYELLVEPGTDELFSKEIAALSSRYSELMEEGTAHLLEAHKEKEAARTASSTAASRTAEMICNYL
ncbi:hypothetical protein BTO28_10770 [Domibacillus epiphyticus]|uniref:Nucleotide kinase n=1 Tax=Domibacillus epiphyticus TaxID=1714355 RepID=A0A1V2A6A5_9BACI|nr:hypothetical protein [Domibacillus epiphyticus]OMP66531.1 hypothetical protein BTO28_10770 [Domibacillus epiphyticus]